MKFEGTKVFGLENALIGMRLPMSKDYEDAKKKCESQTSLYDYHIGKDDLQLCKILINGDNSAGAYGQPNSKYLRMIHVQVAITAPLYWFKEADTYKIGTTSNSTSTMHRLAKYPITKDCFEMDDYENLNYTNVVDGSYAICNSDTYWEWNISHLESLRQKFNETKDKRYWKELIRLLPESWLQTRMWDADYQTLKNIYHWRKNHKLTEWHTFCDWIRKLPYAKELIIGEEK